MSDVKALIHEARAMGASFVVSGERVKVAALAPLPSELMDRLRQHRNEIVEYLHTDFEPWMLREWRRVSIPEWRRVLKESVQAKQSRRENYARWMLREILLDTEYEEPAR